MYDPLNIDVTVQTYDPLNTGVAVQTYDPLNIDVTVQTYDPLNTGVTLQTYDPLNTGVIVQTYDPLNIDVTVQTYDPLNIDVTVQTYDPLNTVLLSRQTKRALEWLLTQRQKDWGWGIYDTPQALLTVQLTQTGSPIERQLSAKQMEIDLVLQLWRHHDTPAMTPATMALYSMALSSICQDPRQFHGHDLIGSLLHPAHEPESDSEFTLCALAVCNSGAHIRKKPLRRLLNIANSKHTVVRKSCECTKVDRKCECWRVFRVDEIHGWRASSFNETLIGGRRMSCLLLYTIILPNQHHKECSRNTGYLYRAQRSSSENGARTIEAIGLYLCMGFAWRADGRGPCSQAIVSKNLLNSFANSVPSFKRNPPKARDFSEASAVRAPMTKMVYDLFARHDGLCELLLSREY
ncbi:hypothetical protein J6590_071551 [Homalodisca vitripennis]|nr:hypothetical protein J6590_071551 [Homalodisca vitripennis]